MKAAPAKRVVRKPKGRHHHPDLREMLVRAASVMVEAEGHEALSLRRIADRLGVTQPALYRHFASKEALLAEVGRRGMAGFEDAMLTATMGVSDPFAALEASGRAYVRYAHGNPGWFRLWFARVRVEELAEHAPVSSDSSAAREALLSAIVAIAPAPEAFDLFRVVWGLAHGLAVFVVERVFQLVQTDEERIAAADAALRLHVECLRARYAR